MVIYLKSHHRQPVFIGAYGVFQDRQGAIPRGWCLGCGMEVFDRHGYCSRCRRKEQLL